MPTRRPPALPRHPRLSQILEQNWQAEMAGYYTYRALAEREPEPGRKQTLENMALAEKEHAALWAGRLRELGEPEPVYRGSPAGDADSLKTRVGGDDLALRRLEIDESRDIAKYSQQLKALGDAPSLAILNRVIEDEQDHYRELSGLIRGYPPGRTPGGRSKSAPGADAGQAQPGPCHTAGWIGDAIYGVNDGWAPSSASSPASRARPWATEICLALRHRRHDRQRALHGLWRLPRGQERARDLRGGACSGARGHCHERSGSPRAALALLPGQGSPAARRGPHGRAHRQRPEQMLRALAAERLNSTEEALRIPLTSALSGALSTAAGAFIPIVPFFFLSGYSAVIISAVVSLGHISPWARPSRWSPCAPGGAAVSR